MKVIFSMCLAVFIVGFFLCVFERFVKPLMQSFISKLLDVFVEDDSDEFVNDDNDDIVKDGKHPLILRIEDIPLFSDMHLQSKTLWLVSYIGDSDVSAQSLYLFDSEDLAEKYVNEQSCLDLFCIAEVRHFTEPN